MKASKNMASTGRFTTTPDAALCKASPRRYWVPRHGQ